jgi:predicted alpha-1,6-mannanase (GH76 family)
MQITNLGFATVLLLLGSASVILGSVVVLFYPSIDKENAFEYIYYYWSGLVLDFILTGA